MSESYDYDDEEEHEEEPYLDCGLMPDGQCVNAGSEECDWECPYSHGEFYAGSRLWHKKHNAGVPVDGCSCGECLVAVIKRQEQERANAAD